MNKKDHRKSYIFFTSLWIFVAMVFMYSMVWFQCYNSVIHRPFLTVGNWLIFALYAFFLLLTAKIYGGYKVGHLRKGNIIFSSLLSIGMVNVVTYFQISLIGRELMAVVPMLVLTASQAALIVLWTLVINWLYEKLYPPRQMLMIYGSELVDTLAVKMSSRPEKYVIAKRMNIDEGLDAIYAEMEHYDGVIICDVKAQIRNKLVKYCYGKSIRTYLTPKISDVIIRNGINVDLFDTPLVLCPNTGLSPEQAFVKRCVDLAIAIPMTIVALPFMGITALLVKLQDGGPVLFKQKRCTINERVFNVLKFRSMIVDAEKDGKSRPCVDNDPRITPVGKFIRKTRLDELPQLFNILKGDMSIVGPRPERIEHIESYSKEIPEFKFRLKVKAGLTGYAQIAGKYNTSAYDKIKLDLMYIERYTLRRDFKLMLMTLKILFMSDSTEGFTKKESEDMRTKGKIKK